MPTFNRSMNCSNGAVASRRQAPSAVSTARDEAGSEQYGPVSTDPRLSMPKIVCAYQKKPNSVVTTTAAIEISSRRRSSCRCSTNDMVPSGFVLRLLRRGSNGIRMVVCWPLGSKVPAAVGGQQHYVRSEFALTPTATLGSERLRLRLGLCLRLDDRRLDDRC